jgi:hypothetical protein
LGVLVFSEMMLGVVEVDKEGLVAKAGCCALHQPVGEKIPLLVWFGTGAASTTSG